MSVASSIRSSPLLDGTRSIGMNRSLVSGNFFDVVGAKPALGRLLGPIDDDVGTFQRTGENASKVMVISYHCMEARVQRRFVYRRTTHRRAVPSLDIHNRRWFAPAQLPRLDTVGVSGATFAVALGVTTFAVLLFGVLPALLAARANLASPLRLDSRSVSETHSRRTIPQALVASQVALAMVMLGGAALLARSLERLQTQSLGFTSDHLSIISFTYNAMKTDSLSKLIALGEQLLPRVRVLPGVTSVTPILIPPLIGQGSWQQRFDREGQTDEDATYNPSVPIESGGPEYFKTFGIPIVKGRAFLDSDKEDAPLVAIVSETVARRFWGSDNPI
jgi:MacB-like protein